MAEVVAEAVAEEVEEIYHDSLHEITVGSSIAVDGVNNKL
jgi:hypothetical protein